MLTEFCIACALPHSVARNAPFHVSLFFSPTIRTTSRATLAASPLFVDWAEAVRSDLSVSLVDQAGEIACEPLLDPVNPELWRALFPPDTSIASWQLPSWEQRKWRSFAARQVHDIARNLHLATMYSNPTNKPSPTDHPLAGQLQRVFGSLDRNKLAFSMPDESRLTAQLDDILESSQSLETIEHGVASETDPLRRMLLELHRCRRFYERPELAQEYRSHPDPHASVPKLPRARSEFHERCAAVGDHSELLRRLGLVVDLRVAEPARLRSSQWLAARLTLAGDRAPFRSPRTRCHVSGDALVSTPAGSDWLDGALRVGDSQRFSVLTLDSDGSALKAERFLWTLPRLMRAEKNDDPVDAASPALRSPGFTVAAMQQGQVIRERLQRQQQLDSALTGDATPELSTEDIARGFRVEVWDDEVRRWASLHRRLSRATVTGFGEVYSRFPEEGFSQGTATHESPGVTNSAIHVHEALFGWEGWSLSAPRPGKSITHVGGEEHLQEEPVADDDELVHPVRIQTEVAKGTLPRLRYGRSYAFRAWAVDLAGNSRQHRMDDDPAAPAGPAAPALLTTSPAAEAQWSAVALREATLDVLQRRESRLAEPASVAHQEVASSVLENPIVGPAVSQRLDMLRVARGAPIAAEAQAQLDRRALVSLNIGRAIADLSQPFVLDPARPTTSPTVTPLQPFLRWEPVSSPVLVPRKRYTEGESLRVLVVRSGVVQNPTTLALKVISPANYAAAANAAVPNAGYDAINERHLAPPKVSQLTSELHGMFDQAIGSTAESRHQKMLGWALRENGTFRDTTRADIDNPPDRLPQPGIALVHVGMPTEALVEDLDALPPGDPLAPGQTVVHDVDELALPYLPDPLARGLSLAFPEAAQDRTIAFPFGSEVFTAAYPGSWPEIEPFRLKLTGGNELDGQLRGKVLTLSLPAGDIQVFRLASSMTRSDLKLMGPWRSLPDSVQANADVAEAAADGLLWGLTPYDTVRLVHAVDRPLKVPRPIKLTPIRAEGNTHAFLFGAVEVHGASTDNLAAEANWSDDVDDLTRDEPHVSPASAKAFQTHIRPYEELALLAAGNAEVTLPQEGKLAFHEARHEFHDTRHHRVDYRFRASTRFREYFAPVLIQPSATDPLDDGQSVIAPTIQISIPSSARPAAPVVHSVIPLFRWVDATEPEQPLARRHVRRAGVRIYIERPWYSSGSGELIGVLLAAGGNDAFGPPTEDDSGFPFVSKWGADPIWVSAPVPRRAMSALQIDSLLHTSGLDDRSFPARPVTPPANLPLNSIDGKPLVTVLGYKPVYNKARKLWYVDVAINPGDTFWPFVRLAICRYQPESVAGCHLSAPVCCDFVQVPPERTASVSRTDDRHVRVVVAGPVGRRAGMTHSTSAVAALAGAVDQHRSVIARLQRRVPEVDSDLGWETVATTRLLLRGSGVNDKQAAWVGELDAGVRIPASRPESGAGNWRVVIEEWERLESDPDVGSNAPHWENRLIYADAFDL